MFCRRLLNNFKLKLPRRLTSVNFPRHYCGSKPAKDGQDNEEATPKLGSMARKYVPFKEEDSVEILDVNEERLKYVQLQELEEIDPFKGLNLERGKTGVFDIEDLIEVLKQENAEDIFVAMLPPGTKYVDFICIVTGKSQRHMRAIIEFVRRVFKRKRYDSDLIPLLEGRESKDWMALDLGNIALHVFSKQARQLYNLESLWAVGPEFDPEYNKKDAIVDMLETHSLYLHKLVPAN